MSDQVGPQAPAVPGLLWMISEPYAAVFRWLGWLVAWAWTIVAGGGGLGLLITRGPWPPTNGWFALFSGLSACPLTAWLLNRYVGWKLSGWVRLGAAFLFILAGRIALAIEGRPFLPHS